jgi:hypothetical protein
MSITGPTGPTDPNTQISSRIRPIDSTGEIQSASYSAIPVASGSDIVTYKEVDEMLNTAYSSSNSNNSMICSIIGIYLKGQKLLYAEAKTHCEQKLHYLMLPSIFFTVLGSVLNLTLKEESYGTTLVSGLNAFIAFLLALVNYLKLDARAEAHRTTAYKFDKLEYSLVFSSGKNIFMSSSREEMEALIKNTEKEIREIKETNPFILPEHIRYSYPILCGTNVFTTVKEVQTKEMVMVDRFKDLLNIVTTLEEIQPETTVEKAQIKLLKEEQRMLVKKIIEIRNDYLKIDQIFQTEIDTNRKKCCNRIQLCGCLKV